jgi:hypothetical protein
LSKKKESKQKIGTLNESSLHQEIKQWISIANDKIEEKVDGYFIDILRGDLLIEVQTSNFYSIKKKLRKLLENHRLHLIYPIPENKYIVKIDKKTGEILSRRKSPKTGHILDLFDELIRFPDLINNNNFSLEVLIIDMNEIRCDDGKGSWRRKGVSIINRELLGVKKTYKFNNRNDFIKLLKYKPTEEFTNKQLAKKHKISIYKARKITYTMRKMDLLKKVGKNSNEIIHKIETD